MVIAYKDKWHLEFLLFFALILVLSPKVPAQSSAAFSLNGVVVDQADAPIPAASVSLYAGPTLIAQTITGSYGQFALVEVRIRQGTLVVQASGFAESKQPWLGNAGESHRLRVVLAPATLKAQVVITATRTNTRLGDTAASVAIITPGEITTTAALRLDDVLRQVVGLQLFRRSGSRTANPTSQGVSLRGTGASGASRAVVFTDGLTLNDPFGGWIYWGRVPRESIDRVEVLRGGASHLYGGAALGGAVNILTREPAAPFLSFEISYGNQQTPSSSLFASLKKQKRLNSNL